MGYGFKHRGGGGSGLAFKVICGAKPASVKENTFWIDTEAIPGWQFSAYEPVEAPDGTVWIETADDADIGVNVLQKNVLMVHPVGAWLNVDGVYKPVAAEVFTGGAWVSFSTSAVYLYINGDTCDELTGGYVAISVGSGSTPVITYGDRQMTIQPVKVATPGEYKRGIVRTDDKIDIAKASAIVFGGIADIPLGYVKLALWSDLGSTIDQYMVRQVAIENGATSCSLDVSDLSGSYYVGFACESQHVQITVTVDELRME